MTIEVSLARGVETTACSVPVAIAVDFGMAIRLAMTNSTNARRLIAHLRATVDYKHKLHVPTIEAN